MVSFSQLVTFAVILQTTFSGGSCGSIWIKYNGRLPGGVYQTATAPLVSTEKNAKIVGGRDALIDNFPYQLALLRSGVLACGASVIALRWTLSAAHCTHPLPEINVMTLRGGSANRLFGGVIFSVVRIVNHPRYSDYTMEFDVSLLQTGTDIVGQSIAPVVLPPATSGFAPGTLANVTGWGLQSVPSALPVQLQWVELPLMAIEQCRSSWPSEWITEDMMCTSQPGRDTCNGDSGGPLVINGYQMGVSSWGVSDCSGNLPAVFASTANPTIRAFIQEHTGV
ncbi:trypsin alpha-3-like [Anopheles nili]|uniref:trypsin alpha-3-like n=1 Tax=Anopheles nili TaxID=185578 RepID=UPI00237AEFBD|nr:trypsin alpha-3-like [Anopheles nili]